MTSANRPMQLEAAFAAVAAHGARLKATPLTKLFQTEADRAERLTIFAPHLTLDLSKQRIDGPLLEALARWAEAADFAGKRAGLFAGDALNATEGRAAWHTALRAEDAPAVVRETRARMRAFAADLRDVDAIVHLGIGGSDLGPRLIADALKPHALKARTLRFAANIDGADIVDALDGLDPARTLIIVCSKTFTTLETLANANAARTWAGKDARLAAVTAAPARAAAWGVSEDSIFPFWDWVGGRYSLWSAIGLSIECAFAPGMFDELLKGAGEMDAHFRDTPFPRNAPALAASVQAFNREALGHRSYALVPYVQRLRLLPAFLQQQEMESNGKRVDMEGRPLTRAAAVVTWGEAGTTAQHSFFQMLHQGVEEIPVEFIVAARGHEGPPAHRAALNANALAQARALMAGRSEAEAYAAMIAQGMDDSEAARLAPHRAFPGDRASTLLGLDALTPRSLGALLAFYEHRTFTQGVLAGINSFDQFGVELGKEMASVLTPAFEGAPPPADLDASTRAWLKRLA